MRATVALMLLSLLTNCGVFRNSITTGASDEEGNEVVVVRPPNVYSRADVDAINAETQCRAIAKNMLQAQRCGIRR